MVSSKGEMTMMTSAQPPALQSAHPAQPARIMPPFTKGLPLVGSLFSLLREPFGFLHRARERYGDIYTLNLGFGKFVMLNHPRHAQHVLRDHANNYNKGGAIWDSVRAFLGNGLVVSEGAFWLRQRRLMQPQFHRQRLAGLTHIMVEAIRESLQTWEQAARSNQPFDLLPAFNRLTMRVAVKTMFGPGLSDEDVDGLAEAFTFVLGYMLVNTATYTLPKWLPVPGRKRFARKIDYINQVIMRYIEQARNDASVQDNLLAFLFNTVDEETGERMSDAQLCDEVKTLFLAGYETTSIALTWAFDFLAHHPDVMSKLRAEVVAVLGEREPAFEDVPKLTYARMVLQEAMRLRPPSFWTARTAVADDEIDGHTIQAGTTVVSLNYMYHHHPEQWIEPETFDPDRFLPERSADRHPFAWLPFGLGQRQCIGRDFALMEGALALAMVVQRYRIAPIADHIAASQPSSTLRPKNGVWVRLAMAS
jgi:cytochrome P450